MGGGALQLNRWFISRLQDLQPSLPIRPPDTRAEELNPDQMFPLFHYRWMAWGHGREGGGINEGSRRDALVGNPSFFTWVLQAWSVCPLKFWEAPDEC